MRIHVVAKKTLEDLASPKFAIPFLAIIFIIAIPATFGISSGVSSNFPELPLAIQEQNLTAMISTLSFIWYAGIPAMILIGVAAANNIAKEEEEGSLRILLSKPVRRWEVILGKFFAILVFSLLVMVIGFSLGSFLIYYISGASSIAFGNVIGGLFLPNLVYAFLVALFVTSVATGISNLTGNQLKTALIVVTAIALLFFMFFPIRQYATSAGYYDDGLYAVDINHNFGNAYIFIHNSLGTEFEPPTQIQFSTISGVYDAGGVSVDPLIGGMPTSLPKSGYVPPAISLGGILVISIAIISSSTLYFEKKDIM